MSAPRTPFLIGVAGGTCSGKTTISENLATAMGPSQVGLIKLASYYGTNAGLPLEERTKVNYDHPDAFDWPLLNDHLSALVAGHTVPVPVYDYVHHERSADVRPLRPAPVIVVEGILVLWEQRLRERFDLRVFIDAAADLRFIRRLQRDVAERGRTPENIIEQYLTTVRPAHEQFIEPSKQYADVIFPEGGQNHAATAMLLARIREVG